MRELFVIIQIVRRLYMQIGRLARPLAHSLIAVLMLSASARLAGAQAHDGHGTAPSQPHKLTPQENALVQAVRQATERFKNVTSVAGPGEGYELAFGCVSGGDFGAMGLHYVNMSLVGDGEVNVAQPEIVLFEPTANGGIRITGADFSGGCRRLGCETRRAAAAHGAALPPVRQPQSLRAEAVLHAARLGVEGQSQRDVHELEP
jgi:hypothetical protein